MGWRWFVLAVFLLLPAGSRAADPVCPALLTEKVSIVLGWTAGVQDAGGVITSYLLERQVDRGAWVKQADLPAATLTYQDGPLVAGHTYTWRIFGVGTMPGATAADPPVAARSLPGVWAVAPHQPPCVTVQAPVPPPGTPLTVAYLTQCPRQCVALTWDSLPAGTAVRVERRISPSTAWSFVKQGVLPMPFVDATALHGTTMCYRARRVADTVWSAEQCVRVQ